MVIQGPESAGSATSRAALVTGASRGIGRATAIALAEAGVAVAVGYRQDDAAAAETVAAIRDVGRAAVALREDLSAPGAPARLVSRAFEQFGRLDILVANAGVLMAQPLLETTIESYDLQNNTNARAVFFLVQAAARHMIDGSGGGSIVLISSDAAVKPFRGLGAYCISKAAVNMLARVAAAELGEYGIRVNVVAPGTTETDMNRELLADPATREELLRSVVLGRPGSPLDVARAVCYLASDAASFVTGASIAVDGGSSAM